MPSDDTDRTDEPDESDIADEDAAIAEESEPKPSETVGADPARDVFSSVEPSDADDEEESTDDEDGDGPETVGADPARDVFSSVEPSPESDESGEEGERGATDEEDATPDEGDATTGGMVFCRACGEEIAASAPTCPHCGAPQEAASETKKEKDPGIAALASIVVPGAGQFYNGQFVRGAVAFVGVGVVDLILVLLAVVLSIILIGPLFLLLIPVVHILVAYDAYDQAEKINRGEVDPGA